MKSARVWSMRSSSGPINSLVSVKVEIVYALPDQQHLKSLELPDNALVRDAVVASGFAEQFREVVVDSTPVGIYGERVSYADQLQDGDRVELYRALVADPKEARRARASQQRGQK